jgi:DNA-binding transcriptional MerR regulator
LERSASGYRLYSEHMAGRLRRICAYRKTGMKLKEIASVLGRPDGSDAARSLLERRLEELNSQIIELRLRQEAVAAMLAGTQAELEESLCERSVFVETLRKAGFSEADMERFHRVFEKSKPKAHRDFLSLLGFKPAEIEALRKRFASKD